MDRLDHLFPIGKRHRTLCLQCLTNVVGHVAPQCKVKVTTDEFHFVQLEPISVYRDGALTK
jgi:hypothetical protein